jgi:hypothetical protein
LYAVAYTLADVEEEDVDEAEVLPPHPAASATADAQSAASSGTREKGWRPGSAQNMGIMAGPLSGSASLRETGRSQTDDMECDGLSRAWFTRSTILYQPSGPRIRESAHSGVR